MKLTSAKVGSTTAIGLEIASGAVRAVELVRSRRGVAIRRFAEVGLLPGAVVDGEIRERVAVVAALRQLWSEGGFSSRQAVLTVSGQRVIVRHAEVVAMSRSDFSSALKFQASDLIPIPIDSSVLDFSILEPSPEREVTAGKMQVLLGAAHRELIDGHLAALREASIKPVGIDVAPMSAVRAALRSAGGAGVTAVVDLNADVTVVAVCEEGVLRFSRILAPSAPTPVVHQREPLGVGAGWGAKQPAASFSEAALATNGNLEAGVSTSETIAPEVDLAPVIANIEGTLSYFASQLPGGRLDRVLVAAGGGRGGQVVIELDRRLAAEVINLNVVEGFDTSAMPDSGSDPFGLYSEALLAIGAAEWAFDTPAQRLSLLPGEVEAAATLRRQATLAGAGVAVVALALGALTFHQMRQVDAERRVAAATTASNNAMRVEIARLTPVAAIHQAVESRLAILRAAEVADIAWSPLLARISAALPPGATLGGISFTGAGGSTSSTSGASTSSTASPSLASPTAATAGSATTGTLGTVTMTVQAKGDEDQVAVWLRAFSKVPGLSTVWVPSAQAGGGNVTFTSSGLITSSAPMVQRSDVVGARP